MRKHLSFLHRLVPLGALLFLAMDQLRPVIHRQATLRIPTGVGTQIPL